MTDGQIPLARPDVGPREEELVQEVLRSGRLSLGPMLERFERDFASWVGSDAAVAVSSGTAALHLAVRALGWGRGDEVVTTPLSFVASANCLLYEDAVPVFCDIDERTLNIDPGAAAAACGPRTVGLLPVHLFGYPADMEALRRSPASGGSASWRTPARRSAPWTPQGCGWGRAATRRHSASMRTSSW